MIVGKKVVMLAKLDALVDVRSAVISIPELDVMRFGPGGRAIAPDPHASAVSHSQDIPLATTEESLLPSEVHALTVVVEQDGNGSARADHPLNGLNRNRVVFALDMPMATASAQRHGRDQHADRRGRATKKLGRVSVDALSQQLHEG